MTTEIAQRQMTSGSVLRPANLSEAIEFARLIAKSKMIPPAYHGKPEDILLAVQMGAELGLAPMQSLQNIACINGKPSVYGDAVLGLVRAFSGCEDVIETIEGEGDNMVAICRAKRRGAAECIARFSVADAKKAGLWNKQGPWQQYPRRMLAMRARGFALRDAFPDVLKGLITVEEAQDYPPTRDEPKDITPTVQSDLDNFAAESIDTPQSLDPAFLALAERTADKGGDAFRRWWSALSKSNRDLLRPHLGNLKARCDKADASNAVDAAEDAFGLQPIAQPAAAVAAVVAEPFTLTPPDDDGPPQSPEMQRLIALLHTHTTSDGCDQFWDNNSRDIHRLSAGEQSEFGVLFDRFKSAL